MNYCNTCCERFVDHLHEIFKYKCKKECQDLTKPESSREIWWHCIESENPKRSIYNFCEQEYIEKDDRKICKTDFCHLCCVTIPDETKTLVNDESLVECNHSCTERYTKTNDIIIG